MAETNYIVMEFAKSNGEKHSIKLAYPKLPAVGSDVKSLGDYMVEQNALKFEDATTLAAFENAVVQTVTETDINLEA